MTIVQNDPKLQYKIVDTEMIPSGSAHENCASYVTSAVRAHQPESYIVRPTQVLASTDERQAEVGDT